jgi:hypothetical protein
MPQKPAVRARKKRRDARRLEKWRAKKELQGAPAAQPPAAVATKSGG